MAMALMRGASWRTRAAPAARLAAQVAGLVLLAAVLASATPAHAWWGDDAEEIARIARVLELHPGSVVADVGAGDGHIAVALARLVGPGGKVFATEIHEDNLDDIRAAVADAGLGNVTVVKGEIAATGLPPACCEAVLLRGVYHHLTEPAAMDASLFQALRPGGLLAAVDFPPSFWLSPWTPEGIPEDRGGHGITPELLAQEVTAAGFTPVAVYTDWPTGWFADRYCALFRKPADASAQPATMRRQAPEERQAHAARAEGTRRQGRIVRSTAAEDARAAIVRDHLVLAEQVEAEPRHAQLGRAAAREPPSTPGVTQRANGRNPCACGACVH